MNAFPSRLLLESLIRIPHRDLRILTDYSIQREHSGLRRILGYGLTITRGAASAMMFTYSTLLITMCYNTITVLRTTVLQFYIPFDSAIDMHKYIAFWALAFTGEGIQTPYFNLNRVLNGNKI